MIDITEIVVAVLGLLGLIVTTVLVPWIKSKMTNEQWQMIVNYAYAGVQAAEIIFNAQGQGEAKFEWTADYIEQQCAAHGIKIDGDTIKVVIESAWIEFGLDKHDKEAKYWHSKHITAVKRCWFWGLTTVVWQARLSRRCRQSTWTARQQSRLRLITLAII